MAIVKDNKYYREYFKKNQEKRRASMLKWYYKNRAKVNLMMTKPKAGEPDEAFI